MPQQEVKTAEEVLAGGLFQLCGSGICSSTNSSSADEREGKVPAPLVPEERRNAPYKK